MAAISFTPEDLLTRAFRLIGVLGEGETLSSEMGTDGLVIANGFLDTLQTQRLTLTASSRLQFSFSAYTSTYTIGPGQTFNTTRPIQIDSAAVLNSTASVPFEIPLQALDDQSYAALPQKTLTAVFPTLYYYNATTPYGSIFFWPTPTDASNYAPILYVGTQLETFADLTTGVTLAPGYYRMLYYNIAIELAVAWGRPVDPKIDAFAMQSMKDIKRNNLAMVDLVTPGALPGADGLYNVYSDTNY